MRASEIDINAIALDNCYDIIESKVHLFRGINQKRPSFVGTIRTDRKLRDSSEFEGFVFDTLIENLNWPFRKANTLSVAIESNIAQEFGHFIYLIQPFNGSTYLYSKECEDFTEIPDTIMELYYDEFGYNNETLLTGVNAEELISNFIKYNSEYLKKKLNLYMTDNPKDLEYAAGEILVLGDKYVAKFYKQI